jgi:hypothetical protein
VRFWKLPKHVTEVHNPGYHLIETENQDTSSIMVFLKKIVAKGFFIGFIGFSSELVGDMFPIIN